MNWKWPIKGRANGKIREEWSKVLKKQPVDHKNPGLIKRRGKRE